MPVNPTTLSIRGKLLTAVRRAARRASVGGPTIVEFATRHMLDGSRDGSFSNMLPLDDAAMDRTDLSDKWSVGSSLKVETSDAHPGAAIVECWTYSVTGIGRYRDVELEDTVYVGVVRGAVVGASARYAIVHAAVLAAMKENSDA